jgi:D-alanine-D-alanine ligase-like ATP-grasp enzyme
MTRRYDAGTALIDALANGASWRREIAIRLDFLRATGPKYAFRRLREAKGRDSTGSPGRDRAYDAIWLDAARELEAELVDLSPHFLEIRRGSAVTRVRDHWVMLDDIVTIALALDKPLVHALVSAAGIPVPDNREVARGDMDTAIAFLERIQAPLVVKPARFSGGGGVTSGVTTPARLARASLRAGRLDSRLMLERQVEGTVYRLLFLDGEFLDAVRRSPPQLRGDGRSTIEALVADENRRRLEARGRDVVSLLRVDLDAIFMLEDAGLTIRSVPAAGELLAVKRATNQNSGQDNMTVRDEIGSGLREDGARAAAAVGVRLSGVDIVTNDPSKSLRETGGAVLEVNGTPGLHYHYQVADRDRATKVAVPILRLLLGV